MKITIFSWNEKFQVKFELAQYEQTYKIAQMDAGGIEEVKAMVTAKFANQVMQRFVDMSQDFKEVYQANI